MSTEARNHQTRIAVIEAAVRGGLSAARVYPLPKRFRAELSRLR